MTDVDELEIQGTKICQYCGSDDTEWLSKIKRWFCNNCEESWESVFSD